MQTVVQIVKQEMTLTLAWICTETKLKGSAAHRSVWKMKMTGLADL